MRILDLICPDNEAADYGRRSGGSREASDGRIAGARAANPL